MSTTELFQKTKRRMIRNTLKLVKRRKVPRLRKYNETIFGKRTLRIFDILYQMAELYATVPGMIFRENKFFLQEWSFIFLQELFRHRYQVNQKKLEKNEKTIDENLNDTIPLLSCDEVIDDLAFDISPTGDPEDEHDDIIPGRVSHDSTQELHDTVQSPVSENESSHENDNEMTLIHKENLFQNVSFRPRKALPIRVQLSPDDSIDLPLSSTKFDSFTERSMFPFEMSAIDNTRLSPTMDQTTVIQIKTPKLSPNSRTKKTSPNKKTPTSASSVRRPTRGRSKVVLSDIVNTNNNLDETDERNHDSTIVPSMNTTTRKRTTKQKRQNNSIISDDVDDSASDITILKNEQAENETYSNDSTFGTSMLDQTHSYSLRKRSKQINYKTQCANTSITRHKRSRKK